MMIAAQADASRNTVKKYLTQFSNSGFGFEEVNALSDRELEDFFGKAKEHPPSPRMQCMVRYFPHVDKELKRTGMTRFILWQAYIKEFPDGYQYSQFCFYFNQWKARVNPTMHMDHKAGDKLYVDFTGEKLHLTDKETGEIIAVEVFEAILGDSQLTCAEAVPTQQKEDFIAACENAMHYIGGIPAVIVPDNLKAAITKSNRYEPTLDETFEDFADHYGATVLPARAYRPRDKALVEGAVKILYTKLHLPLGKEVFHTLNDLNKAIYEAIELHNTQMLKGRNYSRRMQFQEIEKQELAPLPVQRYQFKKLFHARVIKNGHVNLGPDKHYYSVPYRYIGRRVKLLYSRTTVEIFSNYERIVTHKRDKAPYDYTTDKEHMASTHRFQSEWTPDKFLNWAAGIHEDVRYFILQILEKKQLPEQAYKSCLGVLSFAKKIGNDRLIMACQRANSFGVFNYKTIQSILENKMDNYEESIFADELPMPCHDNIRGDYK
ncbi:IS21 family transposase [Mucilaginibacter sp. SMC90]|uniref:IS21 family transposase n=1 Tax=Mucilaginibacter sp. SMC90 TaxID=2929803 RepID=UPI001FB322C0|nr:IS21 family transposase [Mucilaginibacter sp. SMC90]UOE52643.1 IS21 family transposase [Mucilaginibacter sp. SMC90]